MRISSDVKSPYYMREAGTAKVTLDGEELIGCCVMADDERGECECHVYDDDGKLVVDGNDIVTTMRYGKVEITLAN